MKTGELLYREIARRSPHTEVSTFGGAVDYLLQAAGGVASGAAKLAGVPASTFRGWIRGRQPRADRSGAVVEAAVVAQRRARLPKGRERRMRAPGAMGDVKMVGRLGYGSSPEPDREVGIGDYLDEAQNALLDAYLDGAGPDELGEIFHDAISGAPFYEDTFDPDSRMTWDWDSMEGWG